MRESQLTDSKEKTWFVTVLNDFKYIFENEKIKCVSLKVENLSSTSLSSNSDAQFSLALQLFDLTYQITSSQSDGTNWTVNGCLEPIRFENFVIDAIRYWFISFCRLLSLCRFFNFTEKQMFYHSRAKRHKRNHAQPHFGRTWRILS